MEKSLEDRTADLLESLVPPANVVDFGDVAKRVHALFDEHLRRPENIAALVDRFLAWVLPKSVCSDTCVSDPNYQHSRSGTNLLTADEARQMIEHLLAPAPSHDGVSP